jgi:hypothetical protein
LRRSRIFSPAGALLLALAVLLAIPSAAAAQRPDHLHLDVRNIGCDRVEVSGFELPADAQLALRYTDAGSGRVLHTTSVRTGPDGRLTSSAKVSLAGVRTLQVGVVRPGQAQPSVFGETMVAQRCRLPFTGPTTDRVLLLTGLTAALLGAAALVATTATRGRHVRR